MRSGHLTLAVALPALLAGCAPAGTGGVEPRPTVTPEVRPPELEAAGTAPAAPGVPPAAVDRLAGAWVFVHGGSLGLAIFGEDGRFTLQEVGGDPVVLRYRVEAAPDGAPGRIRFRTAAGDSAVKVRSIYKWRSPEEVDLQIGRPGSSVPPGEFDRRRIRLFSDVPSAVRYIRRRDHLAPTPPLHRADQRPRIPRTPREAGGPWRLGSTT